jgi:hypothetical protein
MAPEKRNFILRIAAILLVVAIAGPEMGLGLEAFAVLEIMGAELFFLSFIVGIRLIPISVVTVSLRRWVENHDPNFFVPTISQIKSCPGVIYHAMPGLVSVYFAILVCGIV